MLTSREIRQQYIDYFVSRRGHAFVPSAPVVPHGDPTLLFTNAGMNQFKDVFLGTGKRDYTRAVNTQKCIRAGGKHNDLEDVGRDTYHHTFFEMLGNWSFGDYFKAESIQWAWELLTDIYGLDPNRLHATYFQGDASEGLDPDTEARDLWLQILPSERVHPGNKKDNFWEMGDTGPCGPCSEIHIDLTPDQSGGNLVNAGDARVMEIWNLVFIQFNREASGKLSPLPAKHVDTGMGFERLCSVVQKTGSNYDTDVFTPIFSAIREITGARPYGSKLDDATDTAYRVIADHIRCLTFALTDGAVPSNEGRGYVLRRILRRAVRHGWQTLNVKEPFLHRLVPAVVDAMGDAFPELNQNPQNVIELIREEEESFERTLDRGIALFEAACGLAVNKQISAADAFKLHDTFGFPLDLTQVMAEERGMSVDVAGFNELMEQARALARAGGAGGNQNIGDLLVDIVQKENPPATEFLGYTRTESDAKVLAAFSLDDTGFRRVEFLRRGERAAVVVDRTPFYAEAGGQVGDVGSIENAGKLVVADTQKVGDVYFHLVTTESDFTAAFGAAVKLTVDRGRREKIMANHTSTHLLNRALRLHVNKTADQKGSLVDDEKLRFDFSQNAALTPEQIEQVERTVNTDIASDLPVYYDDAPQEQARQINGLRAVFGEKYPPRVRVVSVGTPVRELLADPSNPDWAGRSIEFCGGTHLAKTGDAEGFTIISEEAVAKGVRRITAFTGQRAHQAAAQGDMLISRLAALKDCVPDELAPGIAQLTEAVSTRPLPALLRGQLREGIAELQKRLKEIDKQRSRQASGSIVETARQIAERAEGNLIVTAIEGADGNTLRDAMDVIRKKRPEAALLLGAADGDKCFFIAAVPKACIDQGLKAGDWVREVAKVAGGGGGGRPDMAQAGGKDPAKLAEALEAGRQFAAGKL